MELSAILVDDEAINILLLKEILSKYCPNIQVIGEASDVETAITEIDTKKPDMVFLDVMLGDRTSFEVLDSLAVPRPQVILVTSEEQYALTAFRYDVTDYLLKTIEATDVVKAVNKVVKRIEEHNLYKLKKSNELKNFIAIASIDKVDLLRIDDIMFFTGDGKYTCIQLSNGKKYFTTKNLGDYERTIGNPNFFRIHHSYIINMNYVTRITKKDGSYCEMSNGLAIPIAKRRQDDFNKFIKVKD